ncbi:VOC family protein [Paenisporosarcina cavernae]|uniref:VOC family protein n=1 Tax=Paenisporosarcina cavernae TaxID=2320858 RepID=A0A385YU33_9BACL|nr:VOC family protein [Paenisporosarcina cavernae]AYC29188.1 VOC family protein [Paenisporosarcina cavernae]
MALTTSPIAAKVNNVFIHVSNLHDSVKWYSELLGLPMPEGKVESPVYNIPVTSTTGLTLDDHTFDPGFRFQAANHVLFNLYTENIDEAYDFLTSKGVEIVREIERFGDFAYFNFQDPDGNVLMICTN